jgi:hypothetical protein
MHDLVIMGDEADCCIAAHVFVNEEALAFLADLMLGGYVYLIATAAPACRMSWHKASR